VQDSLETLNVLHQKLIAVKKVAQDHSEPVVRK
jgi:hypothetical protein